MSGLLHVIENEVQIAALSFLVIVYVVRVIWLLKFTYSKERTFPAGNARAGAMLSLMNVAMPWAMESTRKRPGFYLQFVIFHIGITATIAATFIIPYWPNLLKIKAAVVLFQILIGAALIVGLIRFFRRVLSPSLRLVSSLDDYLSLILLILFFASGLLSVPNKYIVNEWPLIIFFALTALLLVYVPFSKIGHYLYYPFSRFFLGKTMGHRGVGQRKKID